MGGGVCIFGVLTVNLLTSDADNEGDERGIYEDRA